MMKTALIPGSFDPFTKGHFDLVYKASQLYDRVVVAVMINENKKYLFSMEERERIACLSLSELENVSVITSSGWLYRLFDEVGADVIVKGIRNDSDLEYENEMARFNIEKNPRVKTVYLMAEKSLADVSSSAFKSEDVYNATNKYICDKAKKYVLSLLKERK